MWQVLHGRAADVLHPARAQRAESHRRHRRAARRKLEEGRECAGHVQDRGPRDVQAVLPRPQDVLRHGRAGRQARGGAQAHHHHAHLHLRADLRPQALPGAPQRCHGRVPAPEPPRPFVLRRAARAHPRRPPHQARAARDARGDDHLQYVLPIQGPRPPGHARARHGAPARLVIPGRSGRREEPASRPHIRVTHHHMVASALLTRAAGRKPPSAPAHPAAIHPTPRSPTERVECTAASSLSARAGPRPNAKSPPRRGRRVTRKCGCSQSRRGGRRRTPPSAAAWRTRKGGP
mmetsp:Transcript_15176/g.51430  ORF Transcript_15176/g.51430 Transcript_15176/m.51430 type:complete len:291 (-) Transcript_15176:1362-2234(-)